VHLADCKHCLALVGLLSRKREAHTTEPASEYEIARAHAFVRPGFRFGTRSVPQWAAAAVVVIAMAALIRMSQPLGPMDGATDESDAPTTRAITARAPALTLLSPSPGAAVSAAQLTVRWTPVPGSRYYDVRVVTDAGDVVTDQQVTGNEWRPADKSALQPGTEYFVHVDAFIADDKTVSSEHVAFRIAE
jgi:hypothetical protein